jgi:hypothetical protein
MRKAKQTKRGLSAMPVIRERAITNKIAKNFSVLRPSVRVILFFNFKQMLLITMVEKLFKSAKEKGIIKFMDLKGIEVLSA